MSPRYCYMKSVTGRVRKISLFVHLSFILPVYFHILASFLQTYTVSQMFMKSVMWHCKIEYRKATNSRSLLILSFLVKISSRNLHRHLSIMKIFLKCSIYNKDIYAFFRGDDLNELMKKVNQLKMEAGVWQGYPIIPLIFTFTSGHGCQARTFTVYHFTLQSSPLIFTFTSGHGCQARTFTVYHFTLQSSHWYLHSPLDMVARPELSQCIILHCNHPIDIYIHLWTWLPGQNFHSVSFYIAIIPLIFTFTSGHGCQARTFTVYHFTLQSSHWYLHSPLDMVARPELSQCIIYIALWIDL